MLSGEERHINLAHLLKKNFKLCLFMSFHYKRWRGGGLIVIICKPKQTELNFKSHTQIPLLS